MWESFKEYIKHIWAWLHTFCLNIFFSVFLPRAQLMYIYIWMTFKPFYWVDKDITHCWPGSQTLLVMTGNQILVTNCLVHNSASHCFWRHFLYLQDYEELLWRSEKYRYMYIRSLPKYWDLQRYALRMP